MAGKLNAKQKRFCKEYLLDLNATQAASRAGYSEKTAYSQGQRLLKHVEIQALISKFQTERSKRTEITQDRVLAELASIGFADIADFVKTETKTYEVEGEEKEYLGVTVVETLKIPKEKRGAISAIKQGKEGIEIKLNDKVRALELIGKHLGLFNEKLSLNHKLEDDGLFEAIRKSVDDGEV